jgi:flagellar protein FlaF
VGFSVSGSAVIIFIGAVVAAGIAAPTFVGSVDELASAHSEQIDQGTETLNTDIAIQNATYDSSAGTLNVTVENTGSTSLSVNDTSFLVDGEINTTAELTTEIGGTTDVAVWVPAETLEIRTDTNSAPGRVKIVTENGVTATTSNVVVV